MRYSKFVQGACKGILFFALLFMLLPAVALCADSGGGGRKSTFVVVGLCVTASAMAMALQARRVSDGHTIAWKNQTGGTVNVGAVVVVGNIIGVLMSGATSEATTLANNATGVVAVKEMFELPKKTTDTWVEGAKLFWDATNLYLTTTAAGNTYAGTAGGIGANGDTRANVRLNESSDEANGLVGGAVFKSAELTGTGASANTAHGLGVVPSLVWVVPSDLTGGPFVVAYGAHDATNTKTTVTTGEKYRVYAIA